MTVWHRSILQSYRQWKDKKNAAKKTLCSCSSLLCTPRAVKSGASTLNKFRGAVSIPLCESVSMTECSVWSVACGIFNRRLNGSALPARRRELGCRLLFWRCPSHFARSPWKREGRHCSSSSSARAPGDSLRSETCPPQPGSSDPSRDALVTTVWRERQKFRECFGSWWFHHW